MAQIDFPASPTTGTLFTAPGTGVTYLFNGTIWITQAGPGGSTGDFCAVQTSSFPALTASYATLVLTQVISGNASGVYSISTGRYTPPAGRYAIDAGFSVNMGGASALGIVLRKNGTVLIEDQDTASTTSNRANPKVSLIVDANGTDWFDIQGTSSAGAASFTYNMTFQAFPLTGMAGPMGPMGLPAVPGTGDFMARGVPTLASGATVLVLPTIVTGNSGNWYNVANGQYKPPAGRYYISCGCSAGLSGAGSFQMSIGIRKNFVQTASRTYNDRTTAFTYGGVVTDGVFDANGTTDQFDFIVGTNAAASLVDGAWICAFPLTGMQGPQGPPGVAGGGASLTVSDTAPGSPADGAMWWNSLLGTLYLYYNDGTSSQWVPASPAATPGSLIQTVNFQTGAYATGTAIMGGGTPVITDGTEFMTLAITPRSATSKLIIEVVFFGGGSVVQGLAVGLFRDAVTNCLAAIMTWNSAAGGICDTSFKHTMISGTTSPITFRVRAGMSVAGTCSFNGSPGGQYFAGLAASSIVIQEVA